MTRLRVLLAEDHNVMREGLRMVIERDSGLEVVGEADNGVQAIQLTRDLKPAVVVFLLVSARSKRFNAGDNFL